MSDVKLLPCPFCGEARVSDPNGAFGPTLLMTDVWWVACQTCGGESQARNTIKQACAAWNTRPARALTPKQAAAEEMFEALKECMCEIRDRSAIKKKALLVLAKAGQP